MICVIDEDLRKEIQYSIIMIGLPSSKFTFLSVIHIYINVFIKHRKYNSKLFIMPILDKRKGDDILALVPASKRTKNEVVFSSREKAVVQNVS